MGGGASTSMSINQNHQDSIEVITNRKPPDGTHARWMVIPAGKPGHPPVFGLTSAPPMPINAYGRASFPLYLLWIQSRKQLSPAPRRRAYGGGTSRLTL